MSRLSLLVVGVLVAGAIETSAAAQVCTQPIAGVARVDTNGVTVTINIAAGSIPKVNGVSCGFAASSLNVVGVAAKDKVTLDYVPPTMPVTMALAGGNNIVSVFTTNGADTVACTATGLDRDGNSTVDLDLGTSVVSSVEVHSKDGNDVIDCSDAGYKVLLYGGKGDDALDGGPFNDTLDASDGNDTLAGHGGNDKLNGNEGNDIVDGGDGNDTFNVQATFDGNDTFTGGAGTDNVAYSSRTARVVLGGAGAEDVISDDLETIKGGKGSDVLDFSSALKSHNLYGGSGLDLLRAGAGADKLFGEAGDDTLVPNGAKDLSIDGGPGNDVIAATLDGFVETIQCGDGYDTYVSNAEDSFHDCETPGGGAVIPHAIAAGTSHTCAVLANGTVKCWGYNPDGRLGQGDVESRGDGPGEMGASLHAVDLGIGRTAVAVAAGWYHSCAILDTGAVKCWGRNDFGQLGTGDVLTRGDDPGEMGDALPAVDLGTGRTARAIEAGLSHTCAILDNDLVKCWGDNQFGQLGIGDTQNRGDQPGEMGDLLPTVDLGTTRTVVALSTRGYHACAILDNSALKCWGINGFGNLGQGDNARRGQAPGTMGDALLPIDLGTGRTAVGIAAAHFHTCALLDNATVKCWGRNADGELGLADTVTRGIAPGQMGNALPALALGTGKAALTIGAGVEHACARFDDGTAKCWGYGAGGTLGQGDTSNRGDQPGEMGDALAAIALGSSNVVDEIAVGGYHACVRLDPTGLKCWGSGGVGELGLGDTNNRGDQPGEMGDALPAVNLGGPLLDLAFVDGTRSTDGANANLESEDSVGCSSSRGGSPFGFAALLALALATRRRRRQDG